MAITSHLVGRSTRFLVLGGVSRYACEFFLRHSNLTPSLGVNPFEFLVELFNPKTRVLGLSVGDDFVIIACVVLTQCQRVTDGRTDRQTDGETDIPTVANTELCIASYAVALQKSLAVTVLTICQTVCA